jgi:hypothetical protein
MRTYIVGNDGITLCREATPELNEGEIAIGRAAGMVTGASRFNGQGR